jgi:hypothetical protein
MRGDLRSSRTFYVGSAVLGFTGLGFMACRRTSRNPLNKRGRRCRSHILHTQQAGQVSGLTSARRTLWARFSLAPKTSRAVGPVLPRSPPHPCCARQCSLRLPCRPPAAASPDNLVSAG